MKYDVSIQTIGWINGRRVDHSLEISPDFQRRVVWMEKERSALLDTIILGLPFPEVYIQIVTDAASGAQKFIVVDGQQRLTTILMFIDGFSSLPDGRVFANLTDTEKELFWEYKVVVRNLNTTSDSEIRELFARLNTNNVVLNDQELRNAKYQGKFKQTAERLADNPFFQSINLFTPREVRRMEDIEFVSELLLRNVEGVTNKKDLLDSAYISNDEDFPLEAQYESEFTSVIQLINSVTNSENASFIKTKSNFYSVYGAFLEHLKIIKKPYLNQPARTCEHLTALLSAAKIFDSQAADQNPIVASYYNAVSRAASDKSRRVIREKILFDLIRNAESPENQQVNLILE